MSPASYHPSSDRGRAVLGRRATAFLLALALDLLVVLALLWLAPAALERKKPDQRPTVFKALPEPQPTPAVRARVIAKKRPSGGEPPPAPPAPNPPAGPEAPPSWLVSKDEYAASDISRIPSRGVAAGDGAGSGKDSGAAYGPGEGSGGETLHNADWLREPTRAELATYLPANMQTGWALIACQTAPENRVENCRAIDESPRGAGLARGLRLAAWQFRVLPPRIGGRPIIGAWVRIRFDLVLGVTK